MYIYVYKILFPIEHFPKATNIEALDALNDFILCLKCMPVWHLSLLGQCFVWIKFIYFVCFLFGFAVNYSLVIFSTL